MVLIDLQISLIKIHLQIKNEDSSNFINEKNKMKELTYILIKNLEAKGITKEEVINKIIKETLENLNKLILKKKI